MAANKKSAPQIEYKSLGVSSITADESEHGVVEAIVSVFNNVDSANERVLYGAFKDSLLRRKPKMAWSHNWDRIIGKCLEAEELSPGDPRLPEQIRSLGGLRVKASLITKSDDGRNAYEVIKALGDEMEFSIGYHVTSDSIARDGVRDLKTLDLVEFSPVLSGANPATALLSIKSAQAQQQERKDYLDPTVDPTLTPTDQVDPEVEEADQVAAAFATFRQQVYEYFATDEVAVAALNILIDGLQTAVAAAAAQEEADEECDPALGQATSDAGGATTVTVSLAGDGTDAEFKAGRVLSASNYEKIKAAHEHLATVLASTEAAAASDEGKSITPLENSDAKTTSKTESTKTTQSEIASATAVTASDGASAVDERKAAELEARVTALTEDIAAEKARSQVLLKRLLP